MKTVSILLMALWCLTGGAELAMADQTNTPPPAPAPSLAPAPAPATGTAPAQCTTFTERYTNDVESSTGAQTGLLTEIYEFIKVTVGDATETLFNSFVESDTYQQAVFGAMSLMIVIFGVGFTIGVVQASFQQVLTRLIKLAIISTLISPGGWTFFSDTMVKFFSDGTDDLIRGIMAIGTGNTNAPADASPFYELDKLASFILHPDTIISLLGSFFNGGPYGMGMGMLMGMAVFSFFKVLVEALRTYAVAFVARAMILGVAPIFFVFLLFDKTKNMFMAWVNALVSLSLKPILLFTFLSFFIVMMQSATHDMLNADLCWEAGKKSVQGSAAQVSFWTFKDRTTGNTIKDEQTWKGSVDCLITGQQCQEFPINIIDLLTFLLLMYICQRFVKVTDNIAIDLSNATIALDAGGKLEQFFQHQGKEGAAQAPATGARNASDSPARTGQGAGGGTGGTVRQQDAGSNSGRAGTGGTGGNGSGGGRGGRT